MTDSRLGLMAAAFDVVADQLHNTWLHLREVRSILRRQSDAAYARFELFLSQNDPSTYESDGTWIRAQGNLMYNFIYEAYAAGAFRVMDLTAEINRGSRSLAFRNLARISWRQDAQN